MAKPEVSATQFTALLALLHPLPVRMQGLQVANRQSLLATELPFCSFASPFARASNRGEGCDELRQEVVSRQPSCSQDSHWRPYENRGSKVSPNNQCSDDAAMLM